MYELLKYCISFNCLSSLSSQCKECTFVHKECIDRGELTSVNLRRDIVEPSSVEVKGVHRKNSIFILERDGVTENYVELYQVGTERVQVCTERNLCQVQGEEYQRKILIELLNTL
jgi:hypothetical protein